MDFQARTVTFHIKEHKEEPLAPRNIPIYEQAWNKLESYVRHKVITKDNITVLVAKAMQIVQNLVRSKKEPLTGPEKRNLVECLIVQWIRMSELSADDKEYLISFFVPHLLGSIIESFIELDINHLGVKCCQAICCTRF